MNFEQVKEAADFEKAKDEICFRFVGKYWDSKKPRERVTLDFLDLKVEFYIPVTLDNSTRMGSGTVTKELAEIWGKDAESLWEYAKLNTPRMFPAKVKELIDVLLEYNPQFLQETDNESLKDGGIPLIEVSNEQGLYGAAVILYDGILEGLAKELDSDLFILPSSVHATVIAPEKELVDDPPLAEMIRSTNKKFTSTENVLSDSVYRFERGKGIVLEGHKDESGLLLL